MSVSRSWQGGDTPSSVRVCLAWQDLVCAEQQSRWWVLGVLASGVVQQRFVYRSAGCSPCQTPLHMAYGRVARVAGSICWSGAVELLKLLESSVIAFQCLPTSVVSMQCIFHDACWDHVSGGTAESFAVSTTSALSVCPCCVSVQMCAVQRLQICESWICCRCTVVHDMHVNNRQAHQSVRWARSNYGRGHVPIADAPRLHRSSQRTAACG